MRTDDLLLTAGGLVEAGECEDAAKLLGEAMMTARPRAKRRVVAMLERITGQSAAASCNLALALLRGDGIKADPQRGARLLHDVLAQRDTGMAGFAHNFLGHFYFGAFGTPADLPRAVSHFELVGDLEQGEAAFNAGLILEKLNEGITRDVPRAATNYRRAVLHGSVSAMTNLALLIISAEVAGSYPGEAAKLLARAADLGDVEAITVMILLEAEIKAYLAAGTSPDGKQGVRHTPI